MARNTIFASIYVYLNLYDFFKESCLHFESPVFTSPVNEHKASEVRKTDYEYLLYPQR
jgi:hypothetical protein